MINPQATLHVPRRGLHLPSFVLATAVVWASSLPAQTLKQAPGAVAALDKARQVSTLQQPSTPSFHLEASFQTFDEKGAPEGTGTVVEDAMLNGPWKRTVMFHDRKQETYFADGKLSMVVDEDFLPTFVEQRIVGTLFEPIPSHEKLKDYAFEIEKTKLGATPLQCIIIGLPFKSELNSNASARNAAYCLDESTGMLRVIEGHNELVVAFNNILRLGGSYFARKLAISEHGVRRAVLHVDTVAAQPTLQASSLAAPSDASASGGLVEVVSRAPGSPRAIEKVIPTFPEVARDRFISGSVVLHVILGRDGAVRDMELISAPDDVLVRSAMTAVRKWRYPPYLVKGQPVEVDTTITVDYAFR